MMHVTVNDSAQAGNLVRSGKAPQYVWDVHVREAEKGESAGVTGARATASLNNGGCISPRLLIHGHIGTYVHCYHGNSHDQAGR